MNSPPEPSAPPSAAADPDRVPDADVEPSVADPDRVPDAGVEPGAADPDRVPEAEAEPSVADPDRVPEAEAEPSAADPDPVPDAELWTEGPGPSVAGFGPVTRRPRRVVLLALIAVNVWALDLLTKVLAVKALEGRPPVAVLEGVLYLQLVRNPGAAFALATGATWLLTLIAVAVVVAIVKVAGRLRSVGWAVALGLVLGGALGNLADRLFRAPGPMVGHVVDMLSVFAPDGRVWPVFNIADSAICVGGALLVLLALAGRELDGTRSAGTR